MNQIAFEGCLFPELIPTSLEETIYMKQYQ